jgi:four helix bundle protein
MKYDLEERTAKFAENVIDLVKSVKLSPVNNRIVDQLVGSSGSIGANYCEANEAESKKDFSHKIGISKKEIKETKHWLRLLARAESDKAPEIRKLWAEAHELMLIFSKILIKSRGNQFEN